MFPNFFVSSNIKKKKVGEQWLYMERTGNLLVLLQNKKLILLLLEGLNKQNLIN